MARTEIARISPAATRSLHSRVGVVDAELIRRKAEDAAKSPRMREIHILHTGDEDTLQRWLNALQPGSYITPHRHVEPPKAECAVLLQGALGFLPFHDDGSLDLGNSAMLDFSRGFHVVDYRARIWHTFFALVPDTVIFEAKPGPYDAKTDKVFAPWAPPEGSAGAAEYMAGLEKAFREHWALPARG